MVKRSKNINNVPDEKLNDILYSEVFDDEWYNNVSDAINYTFKIAPKLNPETVIPYIIDYNINKQLEEKVLNKLADNLPKTLDWRTIDVIKAFDEFKDIIDKCDVCPVFKKHSLKIILPKQSMLYNEILIWKELVNSNYPNLFITSELVQTKNQYKLKIMRRD